MPCSGKKDSQSLQAFFPIESPPFSRVAFWWGLPSLVII